MQLYFVRHGQSENNAIWEMEEYLSARVDDPRLTEKGERQAEYVAALLASQNPDAPEYWLDTQNRQSFGITHIYCSLMERAVQTGTIIAQRLNLPLVGVPDMHEVGGIYRDIEVDGEMTYSISHGLTPALLASRYPRLQLAESIPEEGWWPGGREERPLRLPRAQRVLEFLKSRHMDTEDRVVVITHGGFFQYLFRALFKIELDNPGTEPLPFRTIYNNCGLTRFDFQQDKFLFLYFNRTDFLPDDLLT